MTATSDAVAPSNRRERFLLELRFDGSRFRGWQKQGEAHVRTVQGVLLDAAAGFLPSGARVDLQGCGRTDAGVHAIAYAAHLDAPAGQDPDRLLRDLNHALPADIAVDAVRRVDPRFHARHSCVGRSYLYSLALAKPVLRRRLAWWPGEEGVDLGRMAEAALLFEGMHDFSGFAEPKERKGSTRSLVFHCRVKRQGDLAMVRIVASHFLWHMVRRIVAFLVEIGRGGMSAKDIEAVLHRGERGQVKGMAPAQGLFFERAFYDRTELDGFVVEAAANERIPSELHPLLSI